VLSLRPEVPPRLAEVIDRCLQKEPDARIQTGDEVARIADEVRGRDLRSPPIVRAFMRNAQVSTLFFVASMLGGKLGLIGIILFVQLVLVARRLLRNGYAFEDIRTALLAEAQVQREEADELQQRRWTRRLNTLWHRIWAGRFGRFFFRVAGAGITPPERRAIASADATELVLGRSVLAVYESLTAGERAQVPDVPAVVERLEKEAEALRAAGRTGEHLAETVAALENVRLAMLKLRAGTGSVGDLTEWLERAKDIGDFVDRRIESERDVRKLLAG
jgi:serine/threonine-protein kinase